MDIKIIIALSASLITIAIFLLSLFSNKKQSILRIDVDDDEKDIEWNKDSNMIWATSKIIKLEHGEDISTKDFQVLIVHGNSLVRKGIKDGSIILIAPIKKDIPFRQQIKLEKVILTFDSQNKNYDLSILQNYDKEGGLITYSYGEDGAKQRKQHIYRESDVFGVAKYIINENVINSRNKINNNRV